MTNFRKFKASIDKQFEKMIENNAPLFKTDISKDDMIQTYLDSFPEGTNEIYRERREHDCSCCKSYIRACGNIVSIVDNKLISIWDAEELEYPYNIVAKELSELVKCAEIRDIFLSKEKSAGTDSNKELLEDSSVKTWYHFYTKFPKRFVNTSNVSCETKIGKVRDYKNVFKRSMDELSEDAGRTILDLIDQKTLYRGEEHRQAIHKFIEYKVKYSLVPDEEKDNWCWLNSVNNPVAKIRNTAIGTLLINLTDDVNLDIAITKFEKGVMAPTNYKRPKAIFTKKMVEEAETKIKELGFENSLERKFATIDDITINNVLFMNRDAKNLNKSLFDELKEDAVVNPKSFDKVQEVSIQKFIDEIIPNSSNISLMIENKHSGNLVSLVGPKNKEAPSILKWKNNFSWSYKGDVTDSMKERVKKAGGKVDGVLRFSIQWNDNGDTKDDLDAHCIEPNRNHIYFSRKTGHLTSGKLDVDITSPGNKVAVENITWSNINKMLEGKYEFFVHCYAKNQGKGGFTAEIEYDGKIYSYEYNLPLKSGQKVYVAKLNFSKKNGIKFIESLPSSSTLNVKEYWGIKTNNFTKVQSIMFSPNYWDNQNDIGNKHYFFFLDNCINDEPPRGFYNEFLNESLLEHKRVFEALGSKMIVDTSDNQLSGLGFSSTKREDIIVKVEGDNSRIIKIKF